MYGLYIEAEALGILGRRQFCDLPRTGYNRPSSRKDAGATLKENLQALLAGVGCTPLLAVIFFIGGAILGRFFTLNVSPPPLWLLYPALLFPLFFGLYLRAVAKQRETPHWLQLWRGSRRKRLVGRRPIPVEEVWLASQSRPGFSGRRWLDDPRLWGWLALATLLPPAYVCIMLGVAVSSG